MKLNTKIKINDLKLSILLIVSLFILGQAFLVLAENKDNQNNLFLDSDQDGLSDQEEKTYGTNPTNSDSDGDGYTDGTEVKSGYNPLKPSPGDKLATIDKGTTSKIVPVLGEKINLTQKLTEQIALQTGLGSDDAEASTEVTNEKIETLVQDFLTTYSPVQETTSLSIDDIKIKKQDYAKLSAEEAKQKKTEDFTNYVVSMFYILSLNSQSPILSTYDFDNALSETLHEISMDMFNSDPSYLKNLNKKTQAALEEIKKVEVPEEFATTHVKMINMILYGLSLGNAVNTNSDDPAADLVNFSKISGFVDTFSGFLTEFETKTSQYELDNNLVKEKLKKLGIDDSWSGTNDSSE